MESISTSTEQRQTHADASREPNPRGQYRFSAKELQHLADLPKDQFYRTGKLSTCALSIQTPWAGWLQCWCLVQVARGPLGGWQLSHALAVVAVAS